MSASWTEKHRGGIHSLPLSAPAADAVRLTSVAEIFDAYLARAPLALALFRSAECRHLRSVHLARPLLDLGCGNGEFAASALVGRPDLGIDLGHQRLAVALAADCHLALAQADAARLPVADDSFTTVLAVSVCEHLVEPARALAEVHRVLRPGGRFVATIVLRDLHERLFYPRLCRRLRLAGLARLYLRLHDRVFRHQTLLSQTGWEIMLAEAGFQIVTSRNILPPQLIVWFDFWLATAWPHKFMQRIGRGANWRPRWLRAALWKWFEAIEQGDTKDGSVLLVIAEKNIAAEVDP
jgi:ubiquinone/menaquinone biosynthesis C-methylase UbiE